MTDMTPRGSRLLVGALLVLTVLEAGAGLWFDDLERSAGHEELTLLTGYAWLFAVTVAAAAVVGAIVAVSQPGHPVGWLFLALAAAVACPVDGYATWALLGSPDRPLPGGEVLALAADRSWLVWFVLVALVLHLTPDGRFLSPRWKAAGWVTTAAGVVALLLSIPSDRLLDPPFDEVGNPFAVPALASIADPVASLCALAVGLGLVVAAGSVVVRFRRSRGDERRRLLWLVLAALPLPVLVVLAFLLSYTDHDAVGALASAGFVTVVPVTAGLSVLRYRLYDVERIVASTVTWGLLSTVVVTTYGFVVWAGARAVPTGPVSPVLSATVGAVAAAGLAFPLRRSLQNQVDRRFNRRAYDARRVVTDALATEGADIDAEAVLRDALADPGLTTSYPCRDGAWLRADGSTATPGVHVDVERHGRVVARIGFDPQRTDADAVRRAGLLAAAELDNTRLRAELAQQVEEIDASRRRLATAQRTERRRIERNLHDGAQQRLIALAMELQSARLNGDPDRMRHALSAGAVSAQLAVRELRALANGLHPAALEDGGLPAALDDIARLSPVPIRVNAPVGRLDRALEFTAWSVIGEAVVNAQKHAGASAIQVDVARRNGHLLLRVSDDGRGGANPDGSGLRGLRDRVETAHGELDLSSGSDGTTIQAVLPCGS